MGMGEESRCGVTKRIIVADDEAHIRHIVSMKLKNAGFEVMTAADGEEALELCAAEKPDMLITDFQMPYMSGLELCMALRQNEQTRYIPALMLTARGFDIEPEEMSQAGILAVLAKPFSPREVLGKVTELLGAAEAATAR
jgi:two-component system, OmpR family, alkaline phosphatase synthesis response regulator PhoP